MAEIARALEALFGRPVREEDGVPRVYYCRDCARWVRFLEPEVRR